MIDKCLCKKASREAAFLCFILIGISSVFASVATPDFAYPKTVAAKAGVELDKSVKNKNGQEALRSAIQLCISSTLISQDNYMQGIEALNKVEKLPSPWNNLAYLLEARMLRDIYMSDRGAFDERIMDINMDISQVKEWNGRSFEMAIDSLLNLAYPEDRSALQTPLSEIKGVLINSDDAVGCHATIGDFIAMLILDIKTGMNMKDSDVPLKKQIDRSYANGNQALDAYLSYYLLNKSYGDNGVLNECEKRFSDTRYYAPFLLRKNFSDNSTKYAAFKRYQDTYPDCWQKGMLDNEIASLLSKTLNWHTQRQVTTSMTPEIKVESTNFDKLNLLVVKVPDSYISGNITYSEIIKSGKIVGLKEIKLDAKPAQRIDTLVTFPSLHQGVYTMVASGNQSLAGIIKDGNSNKKCATFLVSDISCFKAMDYGKGKYGRLYVVEASGQNPVQNAKVTLKSRNSKIASVNLKSGADGCVVLPKGSWTATITRGKDRLIYEIWNSERYSDNQQGVELSAQVLCDRAVCHPGDSVGFVTVVYSKMGRNLNILPDKDIKAVMVNASWQRVDSIMLKGDMNGRAAAYFNIPKKGLLGTYHIMIEDMEKKGNSIGSAYLEVSEYKRPTFIVTSNVEGMRDSENGLSGNDEINIVGLVKTYSGAPEAGANVRYVITDVPYRYFYRNNNSNLRIEGNVTCGSKGEFKISVDPSQLTVNGNPVGLYNVEITATNMSGESVTASPLKFAIGNDYYISADIPNQFCADGAPAKFKVSVHNQLGLKVKKPVFYEIKNDGKLIASGELTDSEFAPGLEKMKSGKYEILLSLSEKFDSYDEKLLKREIIVYHNNDIVPPFETSLWVPERNIVAKKGEESVEIKFGNSYKDASIFAQICDSEGNVLDRWIKSDGKMEKMVIDVPSADSRVYVTLTSLHNLSQKIATITVLPYEQTEELEVATETFRDHITPNSKEQWKFKFKFDGKLVGNVAAMAVMTDKSLNAISPLNWNMSPRQGLYYPNWNGIYYNEIYDSYWNVYLRNARANNVKPVLFPNWEMYGYSLYSTRRYGVVRSYNGGVVNERGVVNEMKSVNRVYATAASADMATGGMSKKMESVQEESSDAEESEALCDVVEAGSAAPDTNETEGLRMAEYPVAFFKPLLTSDENGDLTLDFSVPDFNGTWQFQLLGYTDDLHTAKITKDVVANKPLMVSLNYPQFMRTGDKSVITATIYNLTSAEINADAKMEFFDPLSGEILSTEELKDMRIAADGQYVMSVAYDLASGRDMLGIRVIATDGKNRDGEQFLFPVFPATQPVVDSETFYYSQGDQNIRISIPESYRNDAKNGGKLTLQFCNNPVWECVKALPAVAESEGKSNFNSLVLASKIFSASVGLNLMQKYPEIGEALKYFVDDVENGGSSLKSNLSKNDGLAIKELNSTPWVIDAQSQTLRMSLLRNYLNQGKLRISLTELSDNLRDLQNADGGWSWSKGMDSSPYVSALILEYFARANQLGCFPVEMTDMVKRGVRYYESYMQKELANYNKKVGRYPYLNFLNFYYALSRLNNIGVLSNSNVILNQLLKDINSGWKKLGIEQKCKCAWLLDGNGYQMKAREIVESLRQYATIEKGRGMWYDNVREAGTVPLVVTSIVIQTMNKITPNSGDIDLMRQWLLLNKQTNDWGNASGTSTAVSAILSTGKSWVNNGAKGMEIYIDGELQRLNTMEGFTGSVLIQLQPDSKDVVIKRNSMTPGWGGIVSQSVKPIKDIKRSVNKDIEIKKEIVMIDPDGTAHKVDIDSSESELKVGDKVRVNVIVKCNKEVDYLTVQDAFAAALTPVDKLSGYNFENGVYMYKEIGKDNVSLYIQHLAKGTYVFSFDCMVSHAGNYSVGIAQGQSLYAPTISSHSAGGVLSVTEKD